MENEQTSQQGADDMGSMVTDSDWHALSPKEETDLDTIMSQCDFAISNAELFADQLSRDLSVLDGVSVKANILLVCKNSKCLEMLTTII
jgi:exocyst complex component 1